MNDQKIRHIIPIAIGLLWFIGLSAQRDTITLGYGGQGVLISASSNTHPGHPDNTMNQDGFLPNQNAASRFLQHASLGHNESEIEAVATAGYETWIDSQLVVPKAFSVLQKIRDYHRIIKDSTANPAATVGSRPWRYAWWQYFMNSPDLLRQRVALALSEICVISENSGFGGNAYAMGPYYDILLDRAFGNYKDLLRDITYNAAMSVYLTHLNNPKSNPATNTYPDENYARELMQLFTIGTVLLNNNGTEILDNEGRPIDAYDNDDILEYSKIFTGLTWADRTQFGRGALNDTSYIPDLVMWNSFHEPGVKNLLNGFQVPDRNPVDGVADIEDALQNLFDHPNTPPFVCKRLIQRMVTSNPSPAYVNDVANVFINNGSGVRGDLSKVIKAILLHQEARGCENCDVPAYGMLREPMVRYFQIHKAFNAFSTSGNYRNDLSYIYTLTGQRPLASPSVFNFFQSDFQPIGPVADGDLFAPEFQITNAQTIQGFVNGLYRWLFDGDISDEYSLYNNEPAGNYSNQIANLDLSEELALTQNDWLHVLLDRLNLLLANGSLTQPTLQTIKTVLQQFPNQTETERRQKVTLAIYLVMTSPDYQIKR
ncbi:MAG: DUF1800 family protein [Saprospiraceae bacterium]|nr:DUF1800 family protein [Saprospiraceae bacterium]MBK8547611.1 DUF1800 family protein [Saprospiraceae bacterium]MBK9042695.1 DUF1800 family protein [Saprospiraceae bacterium]